MEVSFNPELQAQLEQLAAAGGRSTDELVREVVTGYIHEAAQIRETLDSRYDDIKSGKVKLIPGEEVIARLREKTAARRSPAQ